MLSMTGFGQARFENKEIALTISVKSVNGRFLDIKFYIPREYAAIEGRLRDLMRSTVDRGTFEVSVRRQFLAKAQAVRVEGSVAIAQQWIKAEREILKSLKLKEERIGVDRLLQRPEVFRLIENQELRSGESQQVLTTLKKALAAWQKESSREGLALKKELEGLLKELLKTIQKMQEQVAEAREYHLEKIRLKMKRLLADEALDQQRLLQEAAIMADKGDITEELSRLTEHLSFVKKLLAEKGAIGKKLDFYCQELLREVNTVGSKSQTSELTQLVVHAKSLVEKMKEQVQNIQ